MRRVRSFVVFSLAWLLASVAQPHVAAGQEPPTVDQAVPNNANTGCQSQADCKAPRVCQAGQCREAGSCQRDTDCPGQQVCEGGRCAERTPPAPAPAPTPAEPEPGVPLTGELAIGGSLQSWGNVPGGLGWFWSLGGGVRFRNGTGILALLGEGYATLGNGREFQLGHVGAGISFRNMNGQSTLGLLSVSSGGLTSDERGFGLVIRHFYPLVDRFGVTLEIIQAYVEDASVRTFGLGLGIAQ